ncbi:MAG: transcriptional regulator GcvA [Sphingomonadales bacterium]|nr:transcriptional regulator GcvA [Sphingomonadales bacterium]
MGRRLPPLISLRVFEAVARHLSFTKAADELHVTQAAVSHQVKKLEEWLGEPLFLRLNRSIKLTKAGAAYAKPLTRAYDLMAEATDALLQDAGPQSLSISTFDSIAAGWLAPRIKTFQADYPEVGIKIVTSNRFSNFIDNEIEAEIRYGDGDWPALHVTKIADEQIFPVCGPGLLGGKQVLEKVEEIGAYPLIHDEMVMEWADWLEAAGGSDVDADRGLRFNHSHIVIQAAINGEGIALGRSLLVADEIAAGRLIRPFGFQMQSMFAYYMVCPKELADQVWVSAFRDWLIAEAQQTMALYA